MCTTIKASPVPSQHPQPKPDSYLNPLINSTTTLLFHDPQSLAQHGNATKMCEHHIMLFRKCDHDFHATKLCSDALNLHHCKDPPQYKLPTYSFCESDGSIEQDWCSACAPLVMRILARLAQNGYQEDILEKLAEAEVRRQNPGNISRLWLASLGAFNDNCICCSLMSPPIGGHNL